MVNILPALARLALGQEGLSSLPEHLCCIWPVYLALKLSAYHRNQELPWYLGGCGPPAKYDTINAEQAFLLPKIQTCTYIAMN